VTSTIAVLVACSDGKRDGPQPSWGLYDSTLFEKSWTAAQMLGQPYVMSAKHGLVPPTQRLEKYDKTLKNATKAEKLTWAEDVWNSLPREYDAVVLLGGRDYVDPLKETYQGPFNTPEVTLYDPYEETTGNGQQMVVAGKLALKSVEKESLGSVIDNAVTEALE